MLVAVQSFGSIWTARGASTKLTALIPLAEARTTTRLVFWRGANCGTGRAFTATFAWMSVRGFILGLRIGSSIAFTSRRVCRSGTDGTSSSSGN